MIGKLFPSGFMCYVEVMLMTFGLMNDRWAFCEKNHVQLRDEYDQIAHDLAPHWAL